MLEVSARGIGHIAHLTRVAPPDIGVVLNVGSAHLGEFGDRAAIAQAKGELVEALTADGVAVLNADDPLVEGMAARTVAPVLRFGQDPRVDVRAEQPAMDDRGRACFTLVTGSGRAEVALQLVGGHHVSNALAAASVALQCGMPLPDVAAALSAAGPRSRWRMEVTDRPDGVTVINDAYNANPESMRAGLDALVAVAGRHRRSFAVLGGMAELGDDSEQEHRSVGQAVARLGIARLIAVGEAARPLADGADLEGSWAGRSGWVPDADAALELIRRELAPGDVVLVKASRSVGLEVLADALTDDVLVSGGGTA